VEALQRGRMDLRSVVVVHETLGRLTLEKVVRSSPAAVVVRAQGPEGRRFDVTLGRHKGRPAVGVTSACCYRPSLGGGFRSRPMTRSVIDGAIIAQARRLEVDGVSFGVGSHGLGEWVDPALSIRRPALVTDAIDGRPLTALKPEGWLSTAWKIVSSTLAMVTVTPSGERTPHRDVKASSVIVGMDRQLHLVDPGVEFTRADVSGVLGLDLSDRPADEPWEEDEAILFATLSAYPTFPPGTPGADLQAIGLMVHEGISGQRPFVAASPAPRVYDFGRGPHGRGVPSPRIVIGEIPRLEDAAPEVTPAMGMLVRSLLLAPFGHELSLGEGRALGDWAALCNEAAGSLD
jgi:hypothetical protein